MKPVSRPVTAFSADGMWWDAQAPDTKWPGTLTFDDAQGASLTLSVQDDAAAFPLGLKSYERILGQASNGKLFTLMNCFERSSQSSLFGSPRTVEVYANELIAGFHAESTDPTLSAVSAQFQHLLDWYGYSGISTDPATQPPDVDVRYATREPITLYDNGSITVTLRSGAGYSVGNHRAAIDEQAWFEISSRTPQPFSELQRVASTCGDLLSIACFTICETEELTLVAPTNGNGRARLGTFHAIPHYRSPHAKKSTVGQMLFTFRGIEPTAPAIFEAWLSKAEQLKDARSLYFEGVYGHGVLEHRLLALTQAAEALHRRLHHGHYMPEDEFQTNVLQPMVAAIPQGISDSLRSAIKARLTFANEYSQRRRLRFLFKEYSAAVETLVAHPESYVNPIVDTRNEFTHFPVPTDGTPLNHLRPEPERVLLFNWILRLLLEASFLDAMGFSKEEISGIVARSDTYRQIARRFREASSSPPTSTRNPDWTN
jgi:hypothetical protein